jgi:hypothetical protein
MAVDPLDYTRLVQRALWGVVRDALRVAAEDGLPGEHHFYIAFRTVFPGVVLPSRLLAEYPQEMTIILQHLFWDLAVDDDRFSVTLRFGGVPEHLEVPFAALTSFVDPSASFGLRFDPQATALAPAEPAATHAAARPRSGPRPAPRPHAAPRPALATATAAKRPSRKRTAGPAPVPAPVAPATKVVDLATFRRQTGERDDPKDSA